MVHTTGSRAECVSADSATSYVEWRRLCQNIWCQSYKSQRLASKRVCVFFLNSLQIFFTKCYLLRSHSLILSWLPTLLLIRSLIFWKVSVAIFVVLRFYPFVLFVFNSLKSCARGVTITSSSAASRFISIYLGFISNSNLWLLFCPNYNDLEIVSFQAYTTLLLKTVFFLTFDMLLSGKDSHLRWFPLFVCHLSLLILYYYLSLTYQTIQPYKSAVGQCNFLEWTRFYH